MFRRSMAAAVAGRGLVLRKRMVPSRLILFPANGVASSTIPTHLLHHSHHYPQQERYFSDRLLGHSPMATATPAPTPPKNNSSDATGNPFEETARIPTERDVQLAGGIWNPTSAKRDKLAELKVELLEHQYTLDDAATEEQARDLYLVDGVQWIAYTAERCRLKEHVAVKSPSVKMAEEQQDGDTPIQQLPKEMDPTQWETEPGLLDVASWMQDQETTIQSTVPDGQLTQEQWGTYLDELIRKLDEVLATLPPGRYLPHVREFSTVPETVVPTTNKDHALEALQELQDEISNSQDQQQLASVGNKLVARYRLQLTRAMADHLQNNWEGLTKLSDEALDRLAVQVSGGAEALESQLSTLSLTRLNSVLRACLTGNAVDRVDSMWDLVDHNGDGLLEKTGMDQVATNTVLPVQSAIASLFQEAVESAPVRLESLKKAKTTSNKEEGDDGKKKSAAAADTTQQLGFFARRREAQAKKRLLKAFELAKTKHFDDEIEMPHRMRCIYAWAEKEHQDNKIDSVLIEASGWSGRKRYVELSPKISLAEFREVQQIHFTHLDRIGWEIAKSFREDLWVAQGRGRQNAELRRNCMIFLLAVCVVDYGIIIL